MKGKELFKHSLNLNDIEETTKLNNLNNKNSLNIHCSLCKNILFNNKSLFHCHTICNSCIFNSTLPLILNKHNISLKSLHIKCPFCKAKCNSNELHTSKAKSNNSNIINNTNNNNKQTNTLSFTSKIKVYKEEEKRPLSFYEFLNSETIFEPKNKFTKSNNKKCESCCLNSIEVFCNNCEVYYCRVCLYKHNLNKKFQKHSVNGNIENYSNSNFCRCLKKRKIQFNCLSCDDYFCINCLILNHFDHNFTSDYEEYYINPYSTVTQNKLYEINRETGSIHSCSNYLKANNENNNNEFNGGERKDKIDDNKSKTNTTFTNNTINLTSNKKTGNNISNISNINNNNNGSPLNLYVNSFKEENGESVQNNAIANPINNNNTNTNPNPNIEIKKNSFIKSENTNPLNILNVINTNTNNMLNNLLINSSSMTTNTEDTKESVTEKEIKYLKRTLTNARKKSSLYEGLMSKNNIPTNSLKYFIQNLILLIETERFSKEFLLIFEALILFKFEREIINYKNFCNSIMESTTNSILLLSKKIFDVNDFCESLRCLLDGKLHPKIELRNFNTISTDYLKDKIKEYEKQYINTIGSVISSINYKYLLFNSENNNYNEKTHLIFKGQSLRKLKGQTIAVSSKMSNDSFPNMFVVFKSNDGKSIVGWINQITNCIELYDFSEGVLYNPSHLSNISSIMGSGNKSKQSNMNKSVNLNFSNIDDYLSVNNNNNLKANKSIDFTTPRKKCKIVIKHSSKTNNISNNGNSRSKNNTDNLIKAITDVNNNLNKNLNSQQFEEEEANKNCNNTVNINGVNNNTHSNVQSSNANNTVNINQTNNYNCNFNNNNTTKSFNNVNITYNNNNTNFNNSFFNTSIYKKKLKTIINAHSDTIFCLRHYEVDRENYLLTCSNDNYCKLWECKYFTECFSINNNANCRSAVLLKYKQERFIVVCSYTKDFPINAYDSQGNLSRQYNVNGYSYHLDFFEHDKQTYLFNSSYPYLFNIYDFNSCQMMYSYRTASYINSIITTPFKKPLVTILDRTGTITQINLDDGAILREHKGVGYYGMCKWNERFYIACGIGLGLSIVDINSFDIVDWYENLHKDNIRNIMKYRHPDFGDVLMTYGKDQTIKMYKQC